MKKIRLVEGRGLKRNMEAKKTKNLKILVKVLKWISIIMMVLLVPLIVITTVFLSQEAAAWTNGLALSISATTSLTLSLTIKVVFNDNCVTINSGRDTIINSKLESPEDRRVKFIKLLSEINGEINNLVINLKRVISEKTNFSYIVFQSASTELFSDISFENVNNRTHELFSFSDIIEQFNLVVEIERLDKNNSELITAFANMVSSSMISSRSIEQKINSFIGQLNEEIELIKRINKSMGV